MLSCRCGSSQIEFEGNLGHSVCTACGEVVEQNAIVSEVTFTEGGGADGFFVGGGTARAASRGGSGIGRMGGAAAGESREQTIANGHRRIAQIGNQMRMTDRQIESAQRYFNIAVVQNFTKGRKAMNVASSCLYIVCRMEKTSHMLIDFSEHLRINLYLLGSTFVKLVHVLKIHDLPLVDPMLYIVRFASKLEFDEKTPDVIRDATRLVSRMDRDWIVKGRKPAGICAACLFIAARMNGFARTPREIVSVVKICEATLAKRLEDFRETPSSALSVDDFQNLMLESSQDPPSFMREKKRKAAALEAAKLLKMKKAEEKGKKKRDGPEGDGEEGGDEVEDEEEEMDEDLQLAVGDMNHTMESEAFKKLAATVGVNMDALDDDLSLLDQDSEVEDCLLTEQEIEIKKMFWEAENKEWEREKLAAGTRPVTKKAKKRRIAGNSSNNAIIPADSVQQAGMNVLASKPSLSKKINYDVIGHLFNDDPSEQLFDMEPARPGNYASNSVTGFGLVAFE
ncbi:cyclin-like protein [Obelidium mucronatum]|nr:cyclin-like protein [Obelidium mucronatum]